MKVKCIPRPAHGDKVKVEVLLSRLPGPKVIKLKARPVCRASTDVEDVLSCPPEEELDHALTVDGGLECPVPEDAMDSKLAVSCQECGCVSEEPEEISEPEAEIEPTVSWEGFDECEEQTVEDEPESETLELEEQNEELADEMFRDIAQELEERPMSASEAFDLLCLEDDEELDAADIEASFAELVDDVDDSLSKCETFDEVKIHTDDGVMHRHFERDDTGKRYETDEAQAEGHEVACFDEDGKLRRVCGVIKKNNAQSEQKIQLDDFFNDAVYDMFGSKDE